jgi:hypothetical protein
MVGASEKRIKMIKNYMKIVDRKNANANAI